MDVEGDDKTSATSTASGVHVVDETNEAVNA